ncbi:MAG TPA: hypothetical protein DEF07_00550 [Nitrosomonas sp.]|nr:hypothetical protein [Nitrosomonas sp.]
MLKNRLTAIVARITVISASVVLVSFLFAANVLADMQMNNQLEYGKSIHTYRTPNVNLIDGREREIDFAAAVEQEEMVIISFAFTSCTGICPVITANLVQALPELQKAGGRYRIFLVSLDPEHDTPARLQDYSERFDTGDKITLLTGSRSAIHVLLRAYNAVYPGGNKMNHQPLTLIRAGRHASWIRLEGLVSGASLAKEVRMAMVRTNHSGLAPVY